MFKVKQVGHIVNSKSLVKIIIRKKKNIYQYIKLRNKIFEKL